MTEPRTSFKAYIQSNALKTYVRMDASGNRSQNPNGFGKVNCSDRNRQFELFEFIPAKNHDCVWNIRSNEFGVYLRMDASKLHRQHMPDGGGTVNCQSDPGEYPGFEDFFVQETSTKGFYNIESANFPGFCLRMIGTGSGDDGFGVVNCQWGAGVNEQLRLLKDGE